jgi:8-oxo-dGTP pyrophosphatase MutT (NUDIX family)
VRRASVAIVLVPRSDEIALLLIARPVRRGDPWSGDIAFPGGLAAADDPDGIATARREALEEVGLELGEPLGRLSDRVTLAPGSRRPMRIRPVLFACESLPLLVPNAREVARIYTPTLSEVARLPRRDVVRKLGPLRMRFSGRTLGDHVLWGLTASMVAELTRRLERGGR